MIDCPKCGSDESRVTDNRRPVPNGFSGNAIGRLRVCKSCGGKFLTCELSQEELTEIINMKFESDPKAFVLAMVDKFF